MINDTINFIDCFYLVNKYGSPITQKAYSPLKGKYAFYYVLCRIEFRI